MSLWLKGKKCTAKDNINIIMSWVGMNSLRKTCRASCPCKFLSYIWGIFSIVMFTSQHNKFQIFFLINSTKEINWGKHCFLLFLRQQCDDAKQCCGSCVCSLCHPCCVLPRPRRQAKRFLSRKGWYSWQQDLLLHVMKNIKGITKTAPWASSNSSTASSSESLKSHRNSSSALDKACKLDEDLWLTSLWHHEAAWSYFQKLHSIHQSASEYLILYS